MILALAVPVLLTVTVCAGVAFWTEPLNVSEFVESAIVDTTPAPLKLVVCGLPAALSVITSVLFCCPAACGVKPS